MGIQMSQEKVERLIDSWPDRESAEDHIGEVALVIRRLGLVKRFGVLVEPKPIIERNHLGHPIAKYFGVYLVDRTPNEPMPEGLTSVPKFVDTTEAPKETKRTQYMAFGETKNLHQWAKAVGVSDPTLKSRIDAGKTMEEALTELALKKYNVA